MRTGYWESVSVVTKLINKSRQTLFSPLFQSTSPIHLPNRSLVQLYGTSRLLDGNTVSGEGNIRFEIPDCYKYVHLSSYSSPFVIFWSSFQGFAPFPWSTELRKCSFCGFPFVFRSRGRATGDVQEGTADQTATGNASSSSDCLRDPIVRCGGRFIKEKRRSALMRQTDGMTTYGDAEEKHRGWYANTAIKADV